MSDNVVDLERRRVRLHVPDVGCPVRAVASEVGDHGAMIECELPWLRLGCPVEAEVAPGDVRHGLVRWLGLDVVASGAARLRVSLEFGNPGDDATEAAFFARASAYSNLCEEAYAEYLSSAPTRPRVAIPVESEPAQRPKPRRLRFLACLLIGLGLGAGASQMPGARALAARTATRIADVVQTGLGGP